MGRGNKERKAFAALTLSLCLLLSGCAQPPKPVTEAETQTILYTAAGMKQGNFRPRAALRLSVTCSCLTAVREMKRAT